MGMFIIDNTRWWKTERNSFTVLDEKYSKPEIYTQPNLQSNKE